MTPLLDGLLALLLGGIVSVFVLGRLTTGYSADEQREVRRIATWGLLLRYAGAAALNATVGGSSSFGDLFWGDSYNYDIVGDILAQYWAGQTFINPSNVTSLSGYGFQYFVGIVYYFFGRNQLLVQLLNATISVAAGLVIYAIARRLFNANVAHRAFLCMAFFPQMIFWSCAMYKDPSILLCIAVCMYAVLRLRERLTPMSVFLFVAGSLYLMTLRFYVFYMVAFAALGTFFFAQRRGFLGGLMTQIVLVAAFASAIFFGVRRETLSEQQQYFDLGRLQTARLGQTTQGRSSFAGDIDVSTQRGVFQAIPVGLVYLLFAPFPWSISGLRQLLTLPETLVWYGLMPALLRGLLFSIRTRLRETLPILVFAGTLTLAYAVFQSNVGTAYRQRTQISMFFFIFMGVGLELRRAKDLGPAARATPPLRPSALGALR